MDGATTTRTADFYDRLAAFYDRLYPDWEHACRDQGQALHALLSERLGPGPLRILDASVGIGTQLLGLSAHGHVVCGTDLSPVATQRARAECAARHTDPRLAVADMRALPFPDDTFDAVISADNAIAHLMSGDEATAALREMRRVTRPGGVLLVTIRDYEDARREHPPGTLPQVWSRAGETTVSFQVWDWHEDGERYDLQHFQVIGGDESWRVARRTASLWAVTRDELGDCARRAGLDAITWLLPEQSGFFQPVLVSSVG